MSYDHCHTMLADCVSSRLYYSVYRDTIVDKKISDSHLHHDDINFVRVKISIK